MPWRAEGLYAGGIRDWQVQGACLKGQRCSECHQMLKVGRALLNGGETVGPGCYPLAISLRPTSSVSAQRGMYQLVLKPAP